MATTNTYSGSFSVLAQIQAVFSGDTTGGRNQKASSSVTFSPTGGTAPTLAGGWHSTITLASGANDVLFAHATAPFSGVSYNDGWVPTGLKLKALFIHNLDETASVTIARAATNGLIIFDAANDAITLGPCGSITLYAQNGTVVLVSGSNDKLVLTPSAGTPQVEILAIYGA